MNKKLLLLIFAGLIYGCSDEPTLKDKIELTKNHFKETIEDLEKQLNPYRKKYSLPAYRRALRLLETNTNFEKPILLVARFVSRNHYRGYYPVCGLIWLESGLNTKGIRITDEEGRTWVFDVFKWPKDEEEKKEITYLLSRRHTVLVDIEGGRKSDDQEFASKHPFPPLKIPIDVFRGKMKVGLITQDGTHTESIDAYITEDFLSAPGFNDPSMKTLVNSHHHPGQIPTARPPWHPRWDLYNRIRKHRHTNICPRS